MGRAAWENPRPTHHPRTRKQDAAQAQARQLDEQSDPAVSEDEVAPKLEAVAPKAARGYEPQRLDGPQPIPKENFGHLDRRLLQRVIDSRSAPYFVSTFFKN